MSDINETIVTLAEDIGFVLSVFSELGSGQGVSAASIQAAVDRMTGSRARVIAVIDAFAVGSPVV